MLDEEYDKEYYIKCKKCKSIAEKIINNRTDKPYTICENCRLKCGGKNKKDEEEQEQETPEWKKLFNISDDKKAETNSERTDENDMSDMGNGELMAGSVENVENVKIILSTLSLNDKIKYIIDLLTDEAKKRLSKEDYIIELINTILMKMKENNNSINNDNDNDNDNSYQEIIKSLNSINKTIDKINNDIKDLKMSIM